MSVSSLQTRVPTERGGDWHEASPPDPVVLARTTTSFGSYGWRWVLFLNEQASYVLTPRAPFCDW